MKNNILDKTDIKFMVKKIKSAIAYNCKSVRFEKIKLNPEDKDYTIMVSYNYVVDKNG